MSEMCDNCLLTYCSYEPCSEECQSARHFENEIGKNMKAKEYVKKYKDTITDGPDTLAEMFDQYIFFRPDDEKAIEIQNYFASKLL